MSASAFTWPVRVYYEDTDAAEVVYHANYLKFMERARTEWLRSYGHDQNALRASTGIVFVVTRLEVRFHLPARLDDELEVRLDVTRMGRAGFDLRQRVVRDDGALLCSADARVGCLDAGTMTPRRLPDSLFMELQRER